MPINPMNTTPKLDPIGRLANVVMTSSRFESMLAFYGDTMALPDFHRDNTSCFFKAGGVNIVVVRGNGEPREPHEKVCLDFAVPDVESTADRLIELASP